LTIERCSEQIDPFTVVFGGVLIFREAFLEMTSLSEFALNLVLHPNPEVIAKRLDQTTVLVDISTSRIFELNETGTRIWELLGQGLNVEQIVQHLVSEFEVEDSQAAEELKTLLSQLRDQGLVAA
jgi:Coenzyme PQQ synthesis protein D (PqqD)